MLPLFVTNALDGQPLPLYGDGKQLRAGIEIVLPGGAAGEIYNLGGGEQVETLEITRRVLELTGAPASLVGRVDDRLDHDRRYSLDSSKSGALGWKRQWTLATDLPATVDWYRKNRVWWD
jgi:dTDP-glucose 4,6-dehydratase